MWAQLALNDFEYEVFDHTTHRSLLLERERGARIAEIMQNFLDQLNVNSEA